MYKKKVTKILSEKQLNVFFYDNNYIANYNFKIKRKIIKNNYTWQNLK